MLSEKKIMMLSEKLMFFIGWVHHFCVFEGFFHIHILEPICLFPHSPLETCYHVTEHRWAFMLSELQDVSGHGGSLRYTYTGPAHTVDRMRHALWLNYRKIRQCNPAGLFVCFRTYLL